MFYVSLVLSAMLLLIVNRVVRRSRQPLQTTILIALAFTLCPMVIFLSPAVAIQALLLVVAVGVCSFPQRRPRTFLTCSVGVTILVYGVASWFAFQDCARLREEYPYVSLQERLPRPPASAGPLSATTAERLSNLESSLEHSGPVLWPSSFRIKSLEQLHEHTVQVFVNRPGFGYSRMSGWLERSLKNGYRTNPPVRQPMPRPTGEWETGPMVMRTLRPQEGDAAKKLWGMHEQGVIDFVNVRGFGFFTHGRTAGGPHAPAEPF
jgi:hypothetical protein